MRELSVFFFKVQSRGAPSYSVEFAVGELHLAGNVLVWYLKMDKHDHFIPHHYVQKNYAGYFDIAPETIII